MHGRILLACSLKHILKRSSIDYMMSMSDSKNTTDTAKLLADVRAGNVTMNRAGRIVTEDGRDLAAVLLGHKGGLKGGKARAARLSPEERQEIARRAAAARWARKDGR